MDLEFWQVPTSVRLHRKQFAKVIKWLNKVSNVYFLYYKSINFAFIVEPFIPQVNIIVPYIKLNIICK